MCRAAVLKMREFEEDVHKHNHPEDNILFLRRWCCNSLSDAGRTDRCPPRLLVHR